MSDYAAKFFISRGADSYGVEGVRLEYVIRDGYKPVAQEGQNPLDPPRHVRMMMPNSPAGLRAVAKALEAAADEIEKIREGALPNTYIIRDIEWEGF